jgi:copper resistance protein C
MTMRHALALIALLAGGGPALAHAFLERAEPAVGSTVAAAPKEVRLYFSQELESSFSGATLSTADGKAIVTGAARLDRQNPAVMVLSLPPLGPGKYKVSWHAVSVDTHRTEGDFTFAVGP